MGVAGKSREHVEEFLSELESTYDSFPVSQTTIAVSAEYYDRARQQFQEGVAKVDVHVHNDQDDVLLIENGDNLTAPGETIEPNDSLERGAKRAVREETGAECRIEAIKQVTIVGVHSDADPDADPVYRLVVILDGQLDSEYTEGQWEEEAPESSLLI